jgi:hypothetical protein
MQVNANKEFYLFCNLYNYVGSFNDRKNSNIL